MSLPRGRQPGWWRRHQARIAPALMVAPALAVFGVLVVAPIGQSLWLALHDWDGFGEPRWIGLGNFVELTDDPLFRISLRNNLIWLGGYALAPVLGLALAVLLAQPGGYVRAAKTLFFMPLVVSNVVIALVFAWFYDPANGLLAKLLAPFGLVMPPLLTDEDLATFAIVAAGLWTQTSFCMVLFIAGLTGVDEEVVAAGRMDGARRLAMLRHVVLPQLIPAAFIAGIVSMIGALRNFDLVSLMTDGGPYGSSTVLAFHMYTQAMFSYRLGYGAAIAAVLFAIMAVFIAVFLVRLVRAERRGGM